MSEYAVGWLATARLLVVVGFATLYWLGGRRAKWARRYLGGIAFGAALLSLKILSGHAHWWQAALVATYPAALSVGYGGETRWEKLKRRALYGLGLWGASAPLWPTADWGAVAIQGLLAVGASLYFGIRNPLKAAEEEAVIATLSTVLVPFL